MSATKIFISHSHKDRDSAVLLDKVLKQRGAETFLDQDRIEAGDTLPDRLKAGIDWCKILLLLWSVHAKASRWVNAEWNLALDRRKKIVPYLLDNTARPPVLDNLVFIDTKDRELAHSNLLLAVFGRDYMPRAGDIFAGLWQADFDAFGLAKGTASLELRKNGQIVGELTLGNSGFLSEELANLGMGGLLNMRYPLRGNWSYEQGTEVLVLKTQAEGFGTQGSETVRIQTAGHESGPIRGTDFSGRSWILRRIR